MSLNIKIVLSFFLLINVASTMLVYSSYVASEQALGECHETK